MLDSKNKKRIIDSQRDAWLRYGYHPNALYWSDYRVQQIRFAMLMEIDIEDNSSLLDIGCGFADFSAFLQQQGLSIDYTGIDLSVELIQAGKERYPQTRLIETELFEFDPQDKSYDYVMLSGTLNRNLQDQGNYALQTIRRMLQVAKKGIAFNLLDANHEWTRQRWDLQSFYPAEIKDYLADLGYSCRMIDHYLDNDFTVLVAMD